MALKHRAAEELTVATFIAPLQPFLTILY